MRRRSHDSSSGFTLIEVLLAFSILVVGMTGILALFTTALGLQAEAAQRHDVARQLGAVLGQIETDLAYRIEGKGDAGLSEGVLFPVPGEPRYRYRVTTRPIPDDPDGRGLFARVQIVSLRRGEEQVYDMGYLTVVPRADNDQLIQKLLSGPGQ